MTDSSPVLRKLRNWQMLLLDLTRANRLLYFKIDRAGSVPITQPASTELFRLLVTQGKKLTFPAGDEKAAFAEDADELSAHPERSGAESKDEQSGAESKDAPTLSLSKGEPKAATEAGPNVAEAQGSDKQSVSETKGPVQPDEILRSAQNDTGQSSPKPRNNVVFSSLTEARLTRALYNLRARAHTAAEEQGVNVLFVAFGLLHWIDAETKETALSPIVLAPVRLEKERGRAAYTIELMEDDLLLNPTLAYKLATDFDLRLPDLPDETEETGLAAYFEQVRGLIPNRPGWSLTDEAILGVFSFQKINLYQDLADAQDLYAAHPIIAALGGGAPLPPPPQLILATELDERVPPSNSFQVIDADASQQEAIEAAKAGVSFVLQGPPGTGKSQTITNIIAESLAAGKHVLFVSQKMAALEVVQNRLNQSGLGDFCLQLHSYKRDKREVVQELVNALDAPDVQLKPDYQTAPLELEATRRTLNAYVTALHAPRFALHRSVFEAHGEIAHRRDTPDVRFSVGDVTSVNAQTFAQRLQLLDRFAAMPDTIDRFQQHPWRGVTLRSVSFAQRKQLEQALTDLSDLLPQYAARMKSLAATCQLRAPRSLQEARPLLDLLKDNDPRLFTLDLDGLSQRFAQEYRSFLRAVKSDYRAEMKELDAINRPAEKLEYEEAVTLLQQAQAVKQTLAGEPAHALSAEQGRAGRADRVADIRSEVRGTLAVRDQVDQALKVLKDVYSGEWPLVASLDPPAARSVNPAGAAPFDQAEWPALAEWLSSRRAGLDQLEPYTALLRLSDEAIAQGLGSFGKAALTGGLPAQQWKNAYLLNFWQAFVDAAAQIDPVLRDFDRHSRETLIERFRELDRQQLILNRARIRALTSDRRPNNTWINADSAEVAILRRETAKKRRLKPLRKLLAEIPRLLADVKPCLMMSPLSVATLLDPHVFKFDVVIFDEASQIAPEEAAGAIMRGAQTVIAGDSKQLPPMRFFSVIGSDDEDAASEEEGRVFESILDESTGLNLPQKMLRWHYRSRDEELIAFSNHHFYADRLLTFPNVQENGQDLGVEFIHVPEGVYRRGRNLRRNEAEARRVVDLIFEHAAKKPDRTLGVITFSYAQRDAVLAEWERRRRDQPQFEAFFDENAPERFFIKNLEMVQGDERDVIIFSVGYGKDETGKVLLNFGPLNQDGGERRLNVAITRARDNVKLVSSIMPEDIDLARTQSLGAKLLRDYMFYARDGATSLRGAHAARERTLSLSKRESKESDEAIPSTMGEIASRQALAMTDQSPLEEAVYQALTEKGLTLHRQVGVSNYRIDLAVVDPQQPGRYLLGIECDGAMYRSAPTARERDRLRQQVLEQLGWRIQRIWSHDWIGNPTAEIERVMARLNEPTSTSTLASHVIANVPEPTSNRVPGKATGISAGAVGEPGINASGEPPQGETFLAETRTPEEVKGLPTYVWPYLVTQLPPHDGPISAATPHEVAEDVAKVAGTEGPVHVDLVVKRISAAWGLTRMTARARQLIGAAIELEVRAKQIEQRGEFLWPLGLATPIVRAPRPGDDPRAIDQIAPEEIAEAAFLCVQEARSLSEADLITQTAKLLGYARVTKKIDAAVTQAVEALKAGGRINEEGGLVHIPHA